MNPLFKWLPLLGLIFGVFSSIGQSSLTYSSTNAFTGVSLSVPVCITSPPGETNRLFIVQQSGQIIVVTNLANPTRTVFMSLANRVMWDGESGLLGLTFHPGYATNGYFYVSYIGQTTNYIFGAHGIISRFQTSSTNANQGDTNSETRLIVEYDRAANHNGGDLHFGPDGYLYASVGDEGQAANYFHNAQHIDSNLFSGILRIDVDKRPGNLLPNPSATFAVTTNYLIPQDNPFVGATNFNGLPVNPNQVRTEFWAVGMRNPWRFTFDQGRLYCADVGESHSEEVNIVVKGGNYGWASYEGTNGAPSVNSTNGQPAALNPIFPITVVRHSGLDGNLMGGNCIIGGRVYRGTRFPELVGHYVFGDYSLGNVWEILYDGTTATPRQRIFGYNQRITTFGTDPRNGDILYAANNVLFRIVSLTASFNTVTQSGGNLTALGVGPPDRNYILLTSTNLTAPAAQWTPLLTNTFSSIGDFSITTPISSSGSPKYYRLQVP